MHTQVDFAKGTASKHLTSPVELCGRLRWLSRLVERLLQPARYVHHLDDSWGIGTAVTAWCGLGLQEAVLCVFILPNVARN